MGNHILITVLLLISLFLIIKHYGFHKRFEAALVGKEGFYRFQLELLIKSNLSKLIGMSFLSLSLLFLFFGNLTTDHFNLQKLFPDYDFSNSIYLTAMVMATGFCMIFNYQKIRSLMKEASQSQGDQFAKLQAQIIPKEKIHNGLFVIFCIGLSMQFLVHGFSSFS